MFVYDGSIPNRIALSSLLLRKGLVGDAVEVGVWRGDFSDWFMDKWMGRCLYLVDPWRKLDDREYDDVRNQDYDPEDYEFVKRRFKKFGERVKLCRMTSEEAARKLPNGLDFVYIDANHALVHVRADLDMWWSKLKVGGILAGHDVFSISHPDVTTALAEFGILREVKVNVVWGDRDVHGKMVNEHSWWIEKK